jgi:hypothetical protein
VFAARYALSPYIKQTRFVFKGLTGNAYGSVTWSVILSEEHRLRVSENRVVRKILGPKRNEVTGDWRKLHSEELHGLYSSSNNINPLKTKCICFI